MKIKRLKYSFLLVAFGFSLLPLDSISQSAFYNGGVSITMTVDTINVFGDLVNQTDVNDGNIAGCPGATIQVHGNIINNSDTGLFSDGDEGSVIFHGDTLGGSGKINFNKVYVNSNASTISLRTSISAKDSLFLSGTNIDLNNHTIDLQSNGVLVGETDSSRVFGNGFLLASPLLSSPSEEISGIGLHITSVANLGTTVIKRGHNEQTAGKKSILRYYDITPAFNVGLDATVRVEYFDTVELNGISEDSLSILASDNMGNTWTTIGFDSMNIAEKFFEQSGIESFGRVTLANPICPNGPTVNLGNDTSFCSSDGITLDAGEQHKYLWSTGETTQSIEINSSDTVSVFVFDSLGCLARDTIILDKKFSPFVDLGNDTSICLNKSLLLDGENTGDATGGTIYEWSTTESTQTIQYMSTIATIDTISVKATNGSNCSYTDSIIITVTACDTTVLKVTAQITNAGCKDDALGAINITVNGGEAPFTYLWSNGDTTKDLTNVATGTYSITVTDNLDSTVTGQFTIAPSTESVTAKFLSASMATSNDTIVFLNLSFVNPMTYFWDFGDTTFSTEKQVSHAFENVLGVDTSYYNVTLTASNATCTDSVTKLIKIINGGPGKKEDPFLPGDTVPNNPFSVFKAINIAPNPTSDRVYINLEMSDKNPITVKLFNIHGNEIYQKTYEASKKYQFDLNLENLAKGFYFVEFKSKNETQGKVITLN